MSCGAIIQIKNSADLLGRSVVVSITDVFTQTASMMDRTSDLGVLFSYKVLHPFRKEKQLKVKGGGKPGLAPKPLKTNMDDKEKAAAEAAQKAQKEAEAAEAKAAAEKAEAEAPSAELAQKDAEIAKLTAERDNYKTVALKRLGKLDGDADFMAGEKDSGLTVEEQVKAALIDREIDRLNKEKDTRLNQILKENAELRLAAKHRPEGPIGSGSGPSTEVKDNVFSSAQLEVLRQKAKRLGADPEKFIEQAKKNITAKG